VSNKERKPMALEDRAKIFVPFDPLSGFREALAKKEREVERAALDERGGNDLEINSTDGDKRTYF
jgi:hypothetical protein